jgi:dTDP-4-amino-4,6-dideoxy-D-galactose acyltransferase
MKKLEWDSAFFGFQVLEMRCKEISSKDIDELQKLSDSTNKMICYVLSSVKVIEGLYPNLYQMPSKITYVKSISKSDINQLKNPQIITLTKTSKINDELLELAYLSGMYSRFKVDKNFSDTDFKRLYKEWVEKSLSRKIADDFLVFKKNNQIVGFLTLKFNESYSEIGLISVDSNFQGEGIGSQLIQCAVCISAKRKYTKIVVSTQDTNFQACAFYEKNNFSLEETTYFSHYWNSKK